MRCNFLLKMVFISLFLLLAVKVNNSQILKDKVIKSDVFDTGKMWTFDFPPNKHLEKTYGFSPSEDWFDDVRLSALRIPGCTASFVSEDGLIMTNNHCATWHRDNVENDGEDLSENGFYAETLQDERKVPKMYAEQLKFFVDVTNDIHEAIVKGSNDEEKVKNKERVKKELIKKYNEETGLKCQFVSLFNGGKYSIYGYKKYNDVRLVFVPEQSIGAFGGDLDNFTYPRYDLDVAFFRVYEDNVPVNSSNYFKFSKEGVQKEEVIFTVGNPGRTARLNTVSQVEYARDITIRNKSYLYDNYYKLLENLKEEVPNRAEEFEKIRTKIGNGQKVYHYIYQGLIPPYIIERKRDFENKIRDIVKLNPNLEKKYGHLWDSIKSLREELKPIETKIAAYEESSFYDPTYFLLVKDIIEYSQQMSMPEKERKEGYKNVDIDSLRNSLYPENIDTELNFVKLQLKLAFIKLNLGEENDYVKMLLGNLDGKFAAKNLLERTILSNREITLDLLSQKNSHEKLIKDPIINYIFNTKDMIKRLKDKQKEIKDTESVLQNLLGKVLFEIHGTKIPPDANFTLRLSDGMLKSFDYNGTKAIEKSTFYGLYNRYYGSDKSYPWNLPKRWETPPTDFDLSTVFNFISTNDIVGGNSGSPVINKEGEVVGLAFDGNTESIIGHFIYLPENNRCVSVASQAIVESLEKVYKAERIVNELDSGEIED